MPCSAWPAGSALPPPADNGTSAASLLLPFRRLDIELPLCRVEGQGCSTNPLMLFPCCAGLTCMDNSYPPSAMCVAKPSAPSLTSSHGTGKWIFKLKPTIPSNKNQVACELLRV